MKKRTSPIWSIPPKQFQDLLNNSDSFVDILLKVGLNPYNGNHKTLNHRIKEEGFDTSILEENRKKSREKHMNTLHKKHSYALDDILVENSKYGSHHLKNKLISQNILKNECSICKNNGEWFGQKLSLQLDHINGINNDNRLENLRLLCPNCHSQTETFSGKRHKKYNFCVECGGKIQKHSIRCFSCSSKFNGINQRKFEVSKDELKNLIENYPMTKVGKILGVSDNAVRKRCKLFGLI